MRRSAVIRGLAMLVTCAAIVAPARAVYSQSLAVTSNTLASVTPTVADFVSGGTNLGTSKTAGVVTLTLANCQKNTSCTIKVSATGVPTAGALRWALTSSGTQGSNVSCTPGSPSSGTLSTTPATVLVCTLGGGANNQGSTGIQVTFSYPVSWAGTPFGNYSTSGITFTLSTP